MPRPVQPPRRDVAGGGGVVQHDQPPAPAAAVPAQRVDRGPDRGGRVDQPPGGCERGVLLADPVGLLGVDPPHRVVVAGEPPRVLRRELGLAHPARTVQGVHHRPARALQPLPQPHQHPVAAGERLVRARHRPPHRRQHPRQPRPLLAVLAHLAGQRWLAVRAAGRAERPQQLRARLLPRPAVQRGRDQRPQQRRGRGVVDADRDQEPRPVLRHAGTPRSTPRWSTGRARSRPARTTPACGRTCRGRCSSWPRSCRRPASPSSPARR